MDLRTQERTEHALFPARAGRLPMVCAEASRRPLSCRCSTVCPGIDGQATNHHLSMCSSPLGLLAFTAYVRSGGWPRWGGARRNRSSEELSLVIDGKAAAVRALRGRCCAHRESAGIDRRAERRLHVFSVSHSLGECRRLLREIHREGSMALEPRNPLSSPGNLA